MTEPQFWQDESPLIQAIAGEEWQELKRTCPVRKFLGAEYPHLIISTREAQELYDLARTKVNETYRRMALNHFDYGDYKLQEGFFMIGEIIEKKKILAETGAFLPEIGRDCPIPFPAIFFKMMYTPEMCEGNNIKKLVSLETSFLDVFENKGYEFHSETGMGCITTHHGMTKVSTVGELDELFSDIRKVYDNIKGQI